MAVLLYIRLPLSLWNVDELLHERGIEIRHESVRFWWNRVGPMFTTEVWRRQVDRMRACRHWRWRLDEVFMTINMVTHYLWRAVEHEGKVLEGFLTQTRDRNIALKFLGKGMKRHGRPDMIATDALRTCGAALKDIGRGDDRETGRRLNNRVENAHLSLRRRERAMLRVRHTRTLQTFAAVHASVHDHFPTVRHLQTHDHDNQIRAAALAKGSGRCAA